MKLLAVRPPLPIPPNRKIKPQERDSDGWLMLDAGEFSVHVVSRAAVEKYFSL